MEFIGFGRPVLLGDLNKVDGNDNPNVNNHSVSLPRDLSLTCQMRQRGGEKISNQSSTAEEAT